MSKFLLILIMVFYVIPATGEFRDPTMPVGQVEETVNETAYNLQYIINRNGYFIAAINGEIVKVGDSFRNMRVSKINNTSVELIAGNDHKTTLELIENVNINYEQK